MSLPVNKKTFRLTNTISKAFRIAVDNFTFAVTFFFRIRERIRITFASKVQAKIFTTINLRRIRSTYIFRMTVKLTQTISSRTIKLVTSPSERKKAVTTILIEHPITFISKAIQKAIVTMSTGRLQLLITPILAQFFTLGDYDPDTLGTLDTETLGDLDYVIT